MKFTSAVLLFLCAAPTCMAFVPSSPSANGVRGAPFMSMSISESVDVKVPYDAAARLAYDEWREQFNKGDFDEARYEVFKANYEAITVANVVAKKEAREEGSEMPALMKLNEFGDFTEEEYMAAMEAESSAPTSTGDVLGKALDAAQSQSEASSALKDAADALAEEEEELAKKLGMESVEELEDALDAMNGIADDGGELESSGDIAREARARAAYLEWCKKFNKQEDEARYPTFVENFLSMEKFAQETGKDMNLNEYADCTEEEFMAMQKAKKPAPAPAPAPVKAAVPAPKPAPVVSAPALTPQQLVEKRLEAEAKLRAEAEAAEQQRQEAKEAMMKAQAEARAAAAKEEEARRKDIEKEQKARQAAQDKAAAKFESDAAAEAIAAAKAAAEKEAAQVAKRRADAEKAAELLRKKNEEWEARQKKATAGSSVTLKSQYKAPEIKIAPKKTVPIKPTPARPKARPTLNVAEAAAALLSAPAKETKKAAPKKAAPKFSFFGSPSEPAPAVKKAAPAPAPVAKKAVAKKAAPAFSFFGGGEKKAAPAPAPKAVAAPAPAPVAKKTVAKKAAPAFSFFGSSEKPAPKKAAPAPKAVAAPAPAPAAKKTVAKKAAPAFSFFGGSEKPAPKKATPAPQPVAPPAPAPVAKKSTPAFSFFGSPAPAKKEAAPAPAPVALPSIKSPPSQPAFSFFGGGAAPQKKAAKKAAPKTATPVKEISDEPGTVALFFGKDKNVEKKVIEEAKRAPTFSLFGGTQNIPKEEPVVVEPPAPAPKRATLSLFGGGAPKKKAAPKKAAPAPKKVDTPVPKGSGTLSLFGGAFGGAKKVAPASKKAEPAARKSIPIRKAAKKAVKKAAKKAAIPAGVPVLARWKQNPDGSITGFISKSPNFRDNTKITTSPIRGKAAAASVVQTGSGSKYYLN